MKNLSVCLSVRQMLEERDDTEPEVEGDAGLDDGDGEEGEGEHVDAEEDGGEDHAGAVGDDEEQGGDQPGEDQPAGPAHRAVHQHNAESWVACQEDGQDMVSMNLF